MGIIQWMNHSMHSLLTQGGATKVRFDIYIIIRRSYQVMNLNMKHLNMLRLVKQ